MTAHRYGTIKGLISILMIIWIGLSIDSCTILDSGENRVISEIYNKQKNKKVILFIKGGNATVDNSFQLMISKADYKLNNKDVGNVFVVDSNHNNALIDSVCVTASWISNDSIMIGYDKRLRTFRKDSVFDNVKIIYKEK
jgi:hypothetical protein